MLCGVDGTSLIEMFYERLGSGDPDRVLDMYTDDAEIVRYDGVAATPGEIRRFYTDELERHGHLRLRQIDRVQQADDVLMWDALVDTAHGILQAVHVVTLDDHGRFRRHVPGIRGYWGS